MALAIAGSDSGGGAGIQADLKAFAAVGVHGTTAITAITAQNTVGVDAIHPVPAEIIVAQVAAVAEDIGVDAVKVGMLGTIATIEAVATALDAVGDAPVVIDPVMVSESGARLLDEEARSALVERLLPRASVVTPNLPEARALLGAGEDVAAVELAAGDPRARSRRRDRDRRPRRRDRPSRRRRRAAPDPRTDPPRRRGARLRLHAQLDARRRSSRSGSRSAMRPSRRAGAPPMPSRWAYAMSAAARGQSMRSRSPLGGRFRRCHNRHMKLVRMKPGHGDQLLAEGDPELAEDEARLVEAFRRQLDLGMWAAVPTREAAATARRSWSASSARFPRDADRVIFIPPAAGG